jgi:capsular exopolysaccharide synthesis family protein
MIDPMDNVRANPSALSRIAPPTHRRLIDVFWRRKWIIVATFLVLTVLTAVVAKSLPKEYETTATLWVTEGTGVSTFESVQAGQALASTYSKVAKNQLLAERVARQLPFQSEGKVILEKMTFEPVLETQLLEFTAADRSPVKARVIANTYARTFIKYSRSELGDAVDAKVTFAAPAALPTSPSRPQPTLYTIAGALISLLLGAGLALLAEVVDRRIRSSEELEDLLGAPVLARLAVRERDIESRESFNEAFRLLRTNLQFLGRDRTPLRSLAVVSPSPGDGKSTVAFNLARSFAEADIQVILIEADMRRPTLAGVVPTTLGHPGGHPGLSEYLSRQADLGTVLASTDLPTLSFISSGLLPPSPSSQFSAERTRVLLQDAMARAELVVVDTPPLSVGAEASTLSASTDATMMVVDLKRSNKTMIRTARQQLAVVGANLVGVTVNRVQKASSVEPYGYGPTPQDRQPRSKRGSDPGQPVHIDA